MTDISKCKGANCPIRERCYRFTAPESEYRQSYMVIDYVDPCPEFWPVGNGNMDDGSVGVLGKVSYSCMACNGSGAYWMVTDAGPKAAKCGNCDGRGKVAYNEGGA